MCRSPRGAESLVCPAGMSRSHKRPERRDEMLPGLMQTTPLQISGILKFAAAPMASARSSRGSSTSRSGATIMPGLEARAGRAAQALAALGVSRRRPGQLARLEHPPASGAVLRRARHGRGAAHRQSAPVRRADRLHDQPRRKRGAALRPQHARRWSSGSQPQLENVRHFVMLSDETRLDARRGRRGRLRSLAGEQSDGFDWPVFDENSAAFLCYTSGTTGDPKGVLYSHRAVVLHAMAGGLSGAPRLHRLRRDHALLSRSTTPPPGACRSSPRSTAASWCCPCDKMDGASLHELIENEGVTFSGGVPTIWTMYLAHLEETGGRYRHAGEAGDRRLGRAARDGRDLPEAARRRSSGRSGA